MNSTTRKLAVHVTKAADVQLTIVLMPLDKDEAVPTTLPTLSQLKDW